MRLSKLAAYGASAAVCAALISGCSGAGSSGVASLPAGSGVPGVRTFSPAGHVPFRSDFKVHGKKISPLELMKLQSEGKLPTLVNRKVAAHIVQQIERGDSWRPKVRRETGVPALWASNIYPPYLLGFSAKSKTLVEATDLNRSSSNNGCYYPAGMKTITSTSTLWVTCEYDGSFNGPAVQEYSANSGAFNSISYNGGCPSNDSECSYSYGYSFDSAENATNVFATSPYTEIEDCNSTSCFYRIDGTGAIWYWTAGNTSQPAGVIPMTGPAGYHWYEFEPVFVDVDSSGNLWVDVYGYGYNSDYSQFLDGDGLVEVVNPTSASPTMNIILPLGSLGYDNGGVYFTHYGKHSPAALAVTNGEARQILIYALPVTSASTPEATINTDSNYEGSGEPLSGNFGPGGSTLNWADVYGWNDACKVKTLICTVQANVDYNTGEGEITTVDSFPSDR
jgi:hypothetical protein